MYMHGSDPFGRKLRSSCPIFTSGPVLDTRTRAYDTAQTNASERCKACVPPTRHMRGTLMHQLIYPDVSVSREPSPKGIRGLQPSHPIPPFPHPLSTPYLHGRGRSTDRPPSSCRLASRRRRAASLRRTRRRRARYPTCSCILRGGARCNGTCKWHEWAFERARSIVRGRCRACALP